MSNADALAQAEAHIACLEEVLADYALRYGLSERARAVFGLISARTTVSTISGSETAQAGHAEMRPFALASASFLPIKPVS